MSGQFHKGVYVDASKKPLPEAKLADIACTHTVFHTLFYTHAITHIHTHTPTETHTQLFLTV